MWDTGTMASWPEFSERQFELACNIELLGGSSAFGVPSTPLEKNLGFDVMLQAGDLGVIAALVGPAVAGGPAGVAPAPNIVPPNPAGQVPGLPALNIGVASLFVQYKVGFHLSTVGSSTGQDRAQVFAPGDAAPFFRVTIPTNQHATFAAWAASVTPLGAHAFYAAPRFTSWNDMLVKQVAGSVHSDSAWIAPAALGASRTWTYDPDNSSHMHHSTPEPMAAVDLQAIARLLQEGAARGSVDVIRKHVSDLDRAVSSFHLKSDPTAVLKARYPDEDDEVIALGAAIIRIRSAANARGIAWALLARSYGEKGEAAENPEEGLSLREVLFRPRRMTTDT